MIGNMYNWDQPENVLAPGLNGVGVGPPCVSQITSPAHSPTNRAIRPKNTTGNQSNSATAGAASGALYIGAFVGIPRSAADNGVVVTVKANKAADPIAKMRRMSNLPSISRNNTLPLTRREAAI